MLEKTQKPNLNGKSQAVIRIRVEFAKSETMRFTSHLDLYRAWERLLRRAGIPLVFSQGYNPRPKLQLAAPLPLGITSRAEIIDFWSTESPFVVDTIKLQLVESAPPGIEIQTIEMIDPAAPPLQKKVVAAQYQVTLLDNVRDLDRKIEALLAAESIMRERRGKTYDLRPLVKELSEVPGDPQHLIMLLNAGEGSTGRPEEVLLALGIQPENTCIERTRLIFHDS
jgi:radical SAM-linked protein